MTAFRINDDEQAILRMSELSHPAKLLYVIGIRPHMDFRTAIVGKVRRISYQGLHEVLEFIPPQGSQRPKADYSIKAIRCLLDELERIGLIRRLPNDKQSLFLECLVADREDAPKNMKGRGRAEKKGRGRADHNPSNSEGFDGFPQMMKGRGDAPMKGTPPVSGKPTSLITAAASLCPVDNFDADAFAAACDEIVAWLRAAEKRRGKIAGISATDEVVKSWVCRNVQIDEIEAAYQLAVSDREKTANPAPIYAKFLDIFIARLIGQRKPWFSIWSGIVQKGLALGLEQSLGEPPYAFRARVLAAAGIDDEEARSWQA